VIRASLEASLRRLGRESVDLFQLHNQITQERRPASVSITPRDLPDILRTFEALQREGKIRYGGITALGETDALHQAVSTGGFCSIQTVYNLLNPSGGQAVPAAFPYQDYRELLRLAQTKRIGAIAIRVLAGGALSGTTDRHPIAMPGVAPLASGKSYAEDAASARRFDFLVAEGVASSLIEAAIRFAISRPEIATAMVGLSTPDHLEQAIAAAERGPLPADVLARLQPLRDRP
jgi:L-galactose dehydrogenase/L-glyceraldehyde 3-phosphate reductase